MIKFILKRLFYFLIIGFLAIGVIYQIDYESYLRQGLKGPYSFLKSEKRIRYVPVIFYRINQILGNNWLYYEAAERASINKSSGHFPLKNGYIYYCYKTKEEAISIRDSMR